MRERRQGSPVVAHTNSAALVSVAALLFVLGTIVPGFALAAPNHPGKWTTPQDWGSQAVHMMLMPGGPSGHHSRVVWWNHGEAVPTGKVLGWDPPSDAAVNGGAFPTFTEYPLQGPLPNWFCAGHTFAADGKLFVTGGDEAFEVGIRKSGFINPDADANGEFEAADDMSKRRWYPTNTLLPDGRIVTHSGSSFFTYLTVGGRSTAGTPVATVERMGMSTADEAWETTLTPTLDGTTAPMGQATEAAMAQVDGRFFVVGGRDGLNQVVSKVSQLDRDHNTNGTDYTFNARTMASMPSARTGHVAVAISGNDFVVLGGHTDLALSNDVLLAHAENSGLVWSVLTPTSTSLPKLRGAVAVFDAGRIFIFGGATTLSGSADNAQVYAMQINTSASTYTLTPVTVTTLTGTSPPTARAYATMVLDPRGHQLDALNTDPQSSY